MAQNPTPGGGLMTRSRGMTLAAALMGGSSILAVSLAVLAFLEASHPGRQG